MRSAEIIPGIIICMVLMLVVISILHQKMGSILHFSRLKWTIASHVVTPAANFASSFLLIFNGIYYPILTEVIVKDPATALSLNKFIGSFSSFRARE
jgi:hypothetical protein